MAINEVLEATKHCSRCHIAKPLAAFFADRSKKSGLQNYCKDCSRIARRAKREPQETKDARLTLTEEQRFVVARFVRRGAFPFPGTRNEYGNAVCLLAELNAVRYKSGQPVLKAALDHARLISPQIERSAVVVSGT